MKQLFDVEVIREVTHTVTGILANTPEEAELIAEDQPFDADSFDSSEIVSVCAIPTDEDDEPTDKEN